MIAIRAKCKRRRSWLGRPPCLEGSRANDPFRPDAPASTAVLPPRLRAAGVAEAVAGRLEAGQRAHDRVGAFHGVGQREDGLIGRLVRVSDNLVALAVRLEGPEQDMAIARQALQVYRRRAGPSFQRLLRQLPAAPWPRCDQARAGWRPGSSRYRWLPATHSAKLYIDLPR